MPETKSDRIAPVRKSVTVPIWPEAAFRRFTEGIAGWWPLATHSVSESAEASCAIEGRVAGRILETAPDGAEHVWGTVTAWEPPGRLAFTWHPGRPEDTRQEVEVTFRAAGEGTRVELVHTGWERLGERASETRARYDAGWDLVLGRYAG
ncbi:MAG TPA: SRPBCC family protein [Gemmatimonadota bacterium]|nr:SRPBCC family protein [Gemmatimonadota bacterium]